MSIILFPRTSLIARLDPSWKKGGNELLWSEIVCTNISVRTRTSAFILIHHLIQLRTREKFFPSIALLRCCGHRSIKFPRWECWFFGWFCYARKERRKFLLGTHELSTNYWKTRVEDFLIRKLKVIGHRFSKWYWLLQQRIIGNEKVFKSRRQLCLFHLHLNRRWIFIPSSSYFPSSVSWYECAPKLPVPINHPESRCLPPRGCVRKLPLPFNRRRRSGKRGNGVLVHRGRGKFQFSLRGSRGIPTTTTTTTTTPRADETRECV